MTAGQSRARLLERSICIAIVVGVIVADAALISHWPLRNSGVDLKGNIPLTMEEVIPGADKDGIPGRAVTFHAGISSVMFGDPKPLSGIKDWTLSFWFKTDMSVDRGLMTSFSLEGEHHRNVIATFFGSRGTSAQIWVSDTSYGFSGCYDPKYWNFVVLVKDGTSLSWYSNGTLCEQKTLDSDTTLPDLSTGGLVLGNDQDEPFGKYQGQQSWKGSLAEMKFFDTAVSAAEAAIINGDPTTTLTLPESPSRSKSHPTMTMSASVTPVDTQSRTQSLTSTLASTPSGSYSSSQGTYTSTGTLKPTRTPGATPSRSTSVTFSLSGSAPSPSRSVLSESPSLERTTSISHIVPEIYLLGREVVGELTELSIVKGRSDRRLTLEIHFGSWNCGFIRRHLHSFFSDTIPESMMPAAGIAERSSSDSGQNSAPSVPASEFLRRRSQLMPMSAAGVVVPTVVLCPDTSFVTAKDVLAAENKKKDQLQPGEYFSIIFAKDDAFSIDEDLNMTLTLDSRVVQPDDGKNLQDLRHAHVKDRFVIRANFNKPAVTVPKAVMQSAKTTAQVGNIASAAAGNPGVAVQGARTSLILSMAECGNDQQDGVSEEDEEELDWASYPIGVGIGTNKTYATFAGAALLNPALVLAVSFLHGGLAHMYSRVSEKSFATICGTSYFPAMEGIVAIPLLQPTAMAATKLLRNSGNGVGVEQVMCAFVGAISCLLLWYGFVWFTLQRFSAKFYSYRELGERHPHRLRVFLTGPGEYRDLTAKELKAKEAERNGDDIEESSTDDSESEKSLSVVKKKKVSSTKNKKSPPEEGNSSKEGKKKKKVDPERLTMFWVNSLFLYFDLYRMERVWYGVIEFGFTIVFGLVEGWEPESKSGCHTVIVLMTIMFAILFLNLLLLKPYVSNFEAGFALFINGVQLASAICATLFLLHGIKPAIDIGGWTAAGGLYVLSIKAIMDMAITLYDLVREKCGGVCCISDGNKNRRRRRMARRGRRRKGSVESGDSDDLGTSDEELSTSSADSESSIGGPKEDRSGLLAAVPVEQDGKSPSLENPLLGGTGPTSAKLNPLSLTAHSPSPHSVPRSNSASPQNALRLTLKRPVRPPIFTTPSWHSDLPPVSSKRGTGNSLW